MFDDKEAYGSGSGSLPPRSTRSTRSPSVRPTTEASTPPTPSRQSSKNGHKRHPSLPPGQTSASRDHIDRLQGRVLELRLEMATIQSQHESDETYARFSMEPSVHPSEGEDEGVELPGAGEDYDLAMEDDPEGEDEDDIFREDDVGSDDGGYNPTREDQPIRRGGARR